MNINSIRAFSNEQLLRDVETAAAHEREATAQLIALLAEMDTRRLYLQQGYSSLFVYCTRCLHPSEHAAYGRIEAARGEKVPAPSGTPRRWIDHADDYLSTLQLPD